MRAKANSIQMSYEGRLSIRSYDGSPTDRSLCTELVREYVEATAKEMEWAVEAIIPYVAEYGNFPGPYAHGDFLIAEVAGDVAGCVGITPGADGLCEMNRLWTRPAYRALGLGKKLVTASLARAAEMGYCKMGLDVLATRRGAIELYLKTGFSYCRPFHDYEFEMVGLEQDLTDAATLRAMEVFK